MHATQSDKVILIVEDDAGRGAQLQGLIEFMDAPAVVLGNSTNWESLLDTLSLAAVFVGADLPAATTERLFERLHDSNPNLPVVLVDPDSAAEAQA
jgi:DNA-binding NtrC family response regulator